MKKTILGGILLLLLSSNLHAYSYPGGQAVKGTVTVVQSAAVNIISTSADEITSYQGGVWNINATVTNSPAVMQGGVWSINSTVTNNPVLGAGDNNIGNVDVVTLPAIPAGANTIGSVTTLGDLGKPFKQDSTGQIYVITAPEAGTNLRKSYTFSNIATGSWVEVGSFTVASGKSFKISNVEFGGLYAAQLKVFDGTTGDEIYLFTSPSSPFVAITDTRPAIKAAGTVITAFVLTAETSNAGTVSVVGFEY